MCKHEFQRTFMGNVELQLRSWKNTDETGVSFTWRRVLLLSLRRGSFKDRPLCTRTLYMLTPDRRSTDPTTGISDQESGTPAIAEQPANGSAELGGDRTEEGT